MPRASQDVSCPNCGRVVKARGLSAHRRQAHGETAHATGVPSPTRSPVQNQVAQPVSKDWVSCRLNSGSEVHLRSGTDAHLQQQPTAQIQLTIQEGEHKGKTVWVSKADIAEAVITIVR